MAQRYQPRLLKPWDDYASSLIDSGVETSHAGPEIQEMESNSSDTQGMSLEQDNTRGTENDTDGNQYSGQHYFES